MPERNVLGGPLESCGTDPMTGFHRDGCCRPDADGFSTHLICAVVTAEHAGDVPVDPGPLAG